MNAKYGEVTMKEKILLIIPAYNEEKIIKKTYDKIVKYNKENKTKYDVIVINDGSKDQTEKILLENNIPHIQLIHNLGIGGAVQTGYKYALENDYDIAIQYDGDGQHNVEYIKDIIKPIVDKKADLVIGSRFIDKTASEFKSTFARLIGIRIISSFIKLTSRKRIYDCTSGFRACNKKTIEHFCYTYPTEYPEPVSSVDIIKNGYVIKEIPVSMNKREEGTSSISSWKKLYYMVNVLLSIFVLWLRGENNE